MVVVTAAIPLLLATQWVRHWYWALALCVVGVASGLTVAVIKVPAMEVNVAAVVVKVVHVTVLMAAINVLVRRRTALMLAVVLMTLLKLRETVARS